MQILQYRHNRYSELGGDEAVTYAGRWFTRGVSAVTVEPVAKPTLQGRFLS